MGPLFDSAEFELCVLHTNPVPTAESELDFTASFLFCRNFAFGSLLLLSKLLCNFVGGGLNTIMRIIFFNVWHGELWEGLKSYLLEEAKRTDIFCFTEVDPPFNLKLKDLFGEAFQPFYHEILKANYLNGQIDGQGIYVRNGLEASGFEKHQIYDITPDDCGILQSISVNINGKKLNIGSVHGKARPGEKFDTPERINQSKKIIEVFDKMDGSKIIGGDFNLLPETESVQMFQKSGYKDLIKDFAIKTTRNKVSWDQFASEPGYVKQYYADFCFASPDVKIKSFEVPNLLISDHLPLVLEIDF